MCRKMLFADPSARDGAVGPLKEGHSGGGLFPGAEVQHERIFIQMVCLRNRYISELLFIVA